MQNKESSFNRLGIAPRFLEILNQKGYHYPTPIQEQAIPIGIEGKDVLGVAQTGTGKTMAFGVPMLQRLAREKGRGLVIVPTRELALQVDEELKKVGTPIGLKTAVLIGGEAISRQHSQLKAKPHVLVVTPGRLIDHLEQGTVSLDNVRILVLDEADRMLDMGFAPQLKRIMAHVPKDRQTMLFSATMPTDIVKLAAVYMKLPVHVEVAPSGTAPEDVAQKIFFVDKASRPALLERLLGEYRGSVLVFTRTKYEAKKLARHIRNVGHSAAEIHSNRSLAQRKDALQGFKVGKYRVLVATDIAARGIDVTGIELVVNYDLPAQAEDYVHRIGRTGRAGASGQAISFAMPHQKDDVRSIERLIRKQLPISRTPELSPLPMSAPVLHERPAFNRPTRTPARPAQRARPSAPITDRERFRRSISERPDDSYRPARRRR